MFKEQSLFKSNMMELEKTSITSNQEQCNMLLESFQLIQKNFNFNSALKTNIDQIDEIKENSNKIQNFSIQSPKLSKHPSQTDPRQNLNIHFNSEQKKVFKKLNFSNNVNPDQSSMYQRRQILFDQLENKQCQNGNNKNAQLELLQKIQEKQPYYWQIFDQQIQGPKTPTNLQCTPQKSLKRPFNQMNMQKTILPTKPCFSEPRRIDFKTPVKEQSKFHQKIDFYTMDIESPVQIPKQSSNNLTPPRTPITKVFQEMMLTTPQKKGTNMFSETGDQHDIDSEFILHQNYELFETIGDGSFGTVYRCQNKIDSQIYAIKRSKKFIQGDLSKKEALAKLSATSENQYVVRYFKAWIDCNQLYIVMEYCKNSLKNQIRTYPYGMGEQQIKKIFKDILNGLDHIHQKKFAHLDIKPDNILLSNSGNYKIADFGLSRLAKVKKGEQLDEGDSMYLAIEMLNPNENTDLTKVDIFSLGISIYQLMINQQLPKNGPEWHDIRLGNLSPLFEQKEFSPELKNLVRDMMQIDPIKRKTAHEILQDEYLNDELQNKLLWLKREQRLLQNKLELLEKQETEQQILKKRKISF